jgi:tetratricopeptide (TPR) repeat protein
MKNIQDQTSSKEVEKMNIKKTDDTKSEERSASLDLARICRVITVALIQLEETKKDKFAADILYELGMCFAKLGLEKEAIDMHKTIVSIWPDYVRSHRQIGFLYFLSNQLGKAINSYNEVLRLCPDDVDAYCSLGDCYIGSDIDRAIEAYKRAMQLCPKHQGIHINLASALFQKMREFGPAMKEYNKLAGADKVSRKIILDEIKMIHAKEDPPDMMELIRKEGFEYDA